MFKSLARRFAGTALLFSGLIGLGTSIVLLLSSCFGYLPYSDRPGPGWWSRCHWPSWAEIAAYIGFAPWFAYFCLFFGLGLFALCIVLGAASTPRWLNRFLGGVIGAAAAGLAVAGAGWYLALAAIGPDAALVLGLIYGIFLFPRFIEPRLQPIAIWIRICMVSCAVGLFIFWIVSPWLPRQPIPGIDYEVMRVTPGDKTVTSTPFLGAQVQAALATLNLRGDSHGGVAGGISGSDQGAPSIDIELIALEPIARRVTLALPKKGYAIYVLKGGVWTAHPSITQKDKRTLVLEPGTDNRFDGVRVKFSNEDFQAFTWYPVISKGQ